MCNNIHNTNDLPAIALLLHSLLRSWHVDWIVQAENDANANNIDIILKYGTSQNGRFNLSHRKCNAITRCTSNATHW